MSKEQLKEISFLVQQYIIEVLSEETTMNQALIQFVSIAVAEKVIKKLTDVGTCDFHDWIG